MTEMTFSVEVDKAVWRRDCRHMDGHHLPKRLRRSHAEHIQDLIDKLAKEAAATMDMKVERALIGAVSDLTWLRSGWRG